MEKLVEKPIGGGVEKLVERPRGGQGGETKRGRVGETAGGQSGRCNGLPGPRLTFAWARLTVATAPLPAPPYPAPPMHTRPLLIGLIR